MKKRTDMNYSMTKKQRKNISESDNKAQPVLSEEEKAALEAQEAEKKEKRKSVRSVAIIAVSVILSIALLVSAVTVYLVSSDNWVPEGNPIAKVHLSNGMDLEYELFMDTAPIATTNFIFLSKIGFFDNTVIHDIQNDWVRFSGYEAGYKGYVDDTDSAHRAQNVDFIKSSDKYFKVYNIEYFKNKNETYKEDRVFSYRLQREKNASSSVSTDQISAGDLFFYYQDSSTMMQIAASDNPQLTITQGGSSPSTQTLSQLTYFGRANNEKTLENLAAINNYAVIEPTAYSYWHRPATEIVIKSIEISNIPKKQWRDILAKTGIDVYFESGIDPERDSYTSSGHTQSYGFCYYH